MDMSFIQYVGTSMQRIIMDTIFLAGSSAEWQGYQLPEAVYSSARDALQMLSNIHNLSSTDSFSNTQSDEATGTVASFLAGDLTSHRD